jgi:hypothetical protein
MATVKYKRTGDTFDLILYWLEKPARKEELEAMYDIGSSNVEIEAKAGEKEESKAIAAGCADTARNGNAEAADNGDKAKDDVVQDSNGGGAMSAGTDCVERSDAAATHTTTGLIDAPTNTVNKDKAVSPKHNNKTFNELLAGTKSASPCNNSERAELNENRLAEDEAKCALAASINYQDLMAELERQKASKVLLVKELEQSRAQVAALGMMLETGKGESKMVDEEALARCERDMLQNNTLVEELSALKLMLESAKKMNRKTEDAASEYKRLYVEYKTLYEESEAKCTELQRKVSVCESRV